MTDELKNAMDKLVKGRRYNPEKIKVLEQTMMQDDGHTLSTSPTPFKSIVDLLLIV